MATKTRTKRERDKLAHQAKTRGTASVSRSTGVHQSTVARWMREADIGGRGARPGAGPALEDIDEGGPTGGMGVLPSGRPRGEQTAQLLDEFRADRDPNRPAAVAANEWARLNAIKSLTIRCREAACEAIETETHTDRAGLEWEMRTGKPRDRFDEAGLRRAWNSQAGDCATLDEVEELAGDFWRKGGYTHTGIKGTGLDFTDYCHYEPGETRFVPDRETMQQLCEEYEGEVLSDFYFEDNSTAWKAAIAAEQARLKVDDELGEVFKELAAKGGVPDQSGQPVMAAATDGSEFEIGETVSGGTSSQWDHDKLLGDLRAKAADDPAEYGRLIEAVKAPKQFALRGLKKHGLEGMCWKEDGNRSIRPVLS